MQPHEFITQYQVALASQNWDMVSPLIHDNACVTFSNGQSNRGKAAVKAAFERNFSIIKSEQYAMFNIHWLAFNNDFAVFTFEYSWKGIINHKVVEGGGVGTSTLIRENNNWLLLAEHLGQKA